MLMLFSLSRCLDMIHFSTCPPMKVIMTVEKHIFLPLSVCHCLLCIAVCRHFHSGLTNIKWIIHVHYLALRGFRWSKCLHDMSENYCTSSLQRCSLKQPEELVLAPILAILLYSAAYSVFSIEVFCILMCLSATVKDAGCKDEKKKEKKPTAKMQ